MTSPASNLSPMERQGALVQDLAQTLILSADPPETWRLVSGSFIPHGKAWAGRIVISDADGSVSGGDAPFAEDSQFSLLLDALQQASAELNQPFVSIRLDARRTDADRDRIAIGADMNYDQDPGSFDGLGGVDAQVAQVWRDRFGDENLPEWVITRSEG